MGSAMTRFHLLLLAAGFALSAQAAPADWKSYLCRYTVKSVMGGDGTPETTLVKVNEKDTRVMIEDRDQADVKIDDKSIHFETRLGPGSIRKADGSFYVMRSTVRMTEIGQGSCKVVDD